ncbi:Os07g0406600, partial [Oryza sativa Japonica Group]
FGLTCHAGINYFTEDIAARSQAVARQFKSLKVYSCSNYWRDHDTALFILKHLYHDIPEETPTDDPERMPIRLFYVRDPIAERFP